VNESVCERTEGASMLENAILLVLAVALMVYLLVCLLRPEKF
jgi:K+-transporting ATPase KdpF subunit